MNEDELGFEAYVVLGNALHLLVNGVAEKDQPRLGLPMDELRRLHASLEPVRANEMLDAIRRLLPDDRQLLARALEVCATLADTQAEHLLGAPEPVRQAVAQHLREAEQPGKAVA